MRNSKQQTANSKQQTANSKQQTLRLFLNLTLGFLLFLNSHVFFAQSQSGVSISWNSEVGCQIFSEIDQGHKDPVFLEDIEENTCLRVCENSNVIYTLSGVSLLNSGTTWNVVGGTVSSSSVTTCSVNWNVSGLGSITFTLPTTNGVITKTICIEKIIKPIALFNVLPEVPEQRNIFACIDQTIYFTNQSNPNGGTGLVPPTVWDFGDGNYSSAFEPSHSYSQPGIYDVILTVTNSCYCTNVHRRKIIVEDYTGFDITCPGVVCDNQTATYSLPIEIQTACHNNFNWSTIGGTIEDVSNNGDATIRWNNVDASGFGYVTFNPGTCEAKCVTPSTLKIPVIQTIGTIQGDTNVCEKSQNIYKLPQWPTTDFRWEVIDNEDGNLAEVIYSEQRNEVIIKPLIIGIITLRAVYTNTLLDCGGTASLVINVSGAVPIIGNQALCKNTTGFYNTISGQSTSWRLRNNVGTLISPVVNGTSFSYNFTTAGNYVLTSGDAGTCPAQQLAITVFDFPTSPIANNVKVMQTNGTPALASSVQVCPNAPYTYSILNNTPNTQYRWAVTNGNIIGSTIGNQVSISFTGVAPAQILIYKESISPITCSSLPTTIPITIEQINAEIAGESVACSSSYLDYQVNTIGTSVLYNEGETYTWSISPATLGTVSTGQGTNEVSILWNNVSSITSATITVTINKCTLSTPFTKTVQINPTPIIDIVATPTTACAGSPITFNIVSTNNVPITSGTVTWNFGYGDQIGSITNQQFIFNNATGINIGKNITAYITNANGCTSVSNTANVTVTIKPAPPASASLSSDYNTFCEQSQIDALFSAATTTGSTIQWYLNGVALVGEVYETLTVTPAMGFGNYTFTAINTAGCVKTSNIVRVIQNCGSEPCIYLPEPFLTNTSTNNCGILNLIGTTSDQNYESVSWTIYGPAGTILNYTDPTYTTTIAGDYHIFYDAYYVNSSGDICKFSDDIIVTVPYIPDFAYTAVCNDNNNFTVDLVDETNFFGPVTNRNVVYYYRTTLPATSPWLPVTGNQITSLLPVAGGYKLKIVVQGNLFGVQQTACEKIVNLTLSAIPNNLSVIIEPDPIDCYDTAVGFSINNPQPNYNYLWTFEPGAENSLANPNRVFTSTGAKTVRVVVTNQYGCSKEFFKNIIIPEKCFNGTVTSSPNNATVCAGNPITLQYVPNGDTCPVELYTWMNGTDPVIPAQNTASINTTTAGFYWVKVKKGVCKYETPNRIVPIINQPPTVTLQSPAATCFGTLLTIKALTNATVLRWRINNVAQPAYNNLTQLSNNTLAIGTHTISVSVYSGDPSLPSTCVAIATQNVIIRTVPSTPIITQQVICKDQDPLRPYYHVILTATSNVSGVFNWSNGQQGATITVFDGGPYRVEVTNGGCSSFSQVDVPKNPENYIWIFPNGCQTACRLDDANALGTLIGPRLPLQYWAWLLNNNPILSGVQNTFADPLPLTYSGTYNLEINTGVCGMVSSPLDYNEVECAKCGVQNVELISYELIEGKFCSFYIKLNITSENPFEGVLTAPNDDFIIVPSQISINPGENNVITTVIPLGNFTGGVVNFQIDGVLPNGQPCYNPFVIILPSCFEENGGPSKSNTSNNGNVIIAPNPAKEQVTIQFKNLAVNSTIELFDLSGRNITNFQTTTSTGNLTLATSSFPTGIYLVVVRTNGALVSQQKLIIQ